MSTHRNLAYSLPVVEPVPGTVGCRASRLACCLACCGPTGRPPISPRRGITGLVPSNRLGWSVSGLVGWFLYRTCMANETNRQRRGPQSLFTNCSEVPLWVFILSSEIKRLREFGHRFPSARDRLETEWANSEMAQVLNATDAPSLSGSFPRL